MRSVVLLIINCYVIRVLVFLLAPFWLYEYNGMIVNVLTKGLQHLGLRRSKGYCQQNHDALQK